MPVRLLRDGILTSEAVNSLDAHAELFYRRLMSVVDDFGRYDANPKLLRPACYPLQIDRIREADIARWLTEVELAGLVLLYEVAGKRYIQMHKLGTPRAKASKYPPPPSSESICAQMKADESRCTQTHTSVPNACSYSNANSNACSDDAQAAPPPETPPSQASPMAAPTGSSPPAPPPADDPVDAEIRAFCRDHRMLVWSLKVHQHLKKLVKGAGWETARECIDAAVAAGAGEPASYALSVWASRQTQAAIKRNKAKPSPAFFREDN